MFGRASAQCMQAAMDVGVFVFVKISNGVEHLFRLLRAGRVIEIDQSMAVHALAQNREIVAERFPIDAVTGRFVHEIICSKRRFAPLYSKRTPRSILAAVWLDFVSVKSLQPWSQRTLTRRSYASFLSK